MQDRGAWCRFLLCVQCNFVTRDDRWPWPSSICLSPGSLAACLYTASASSRLIPSSAAASRAAPIVSLQQAFDHLPACFIVRSLSLLASSQIPAPRTTFAETPLLEVCPAKVGPRNFVFQQHFSWVSGHHLSGSLNSNLDVERIVTAILRPGSDPHLEYAVSVPPLRLGYSPDVRRTCPDR